MRFPENKIKEALLHPDLDVRDLAIRYFYHLANPDVSVMPVVIQALERYGRATTFSFTRYFNLLPQTEQTIGWVIDELQRDFLGLPEEKYFYFLDLSRLLLHADMALIVPRAQAIQQTLYFEAGERDAFRERLEMHGWTADKCWRELQNYCETTKDLEDIDNGHGIRIIEALAHQPHDYRGQILAGLAETVPDFRNDARKWLQPFLANLAGMMGLSEAIPALVANLGHPYTLLATQSRDALAKIGTEEVVSLVCDRFPGASRDFRDEACDLLGKIPLDATVRRILEILPGESDLIIRLILCQALLDHFSLEAVEPARSLIRQNAITPDLRHLCCNLIAFCKATGMRFPEFAEWEKKTRKDGEAEWAATRRIQKLVFESGGDFKQVIQKMKAEVAALESNRQRLEAEKKKLQAKNNFLRRRIREHSSPRKPNRIGRNDPCYCGSGKKFKHCCLARAAQNSRI